MKPEQLGPYRIVGTLGRGGMGVVYEGVNIETDEPAAIKILPAMQAEALGFRQRFEAEIETLRKLYHPNIVQLFGFGEEEGVLFYAMELVRGCSLEDELKRGRVFEWREVARIGVQLCRALRHAHDRGVIHRDIKPANLLLAQDGVVKLSDFGIARLFGNSRMTAAGNILGTVEYMAPEQADGRPVGPRTDLYSLGGALYTVLARQPPFRANSAGEMIDKHRSERPAPVRRYAPAVPEEFEHIIAQLLEKEPEKRIVNATMVARRLEAMLHALANAPQNEPPSASSSVPAGSPTQRSSPNRPAPTGEPGAVTEVPPTRVAGPSWGRASGPGGQSVGASASAETRAIEDQPPSVPQSDVEPPMAETRAASEVLPAPEQADPGTCPGDRLTQATTRFVVVDEEDLDRVESDQKAPPWISPQTWILVVALLGVGGVVWYLLRPPTADTLYAKIGSLTADKSVDSFMVAEPYLKEFLMRFPGDSRAEQLRVYEREVELYRMERKLELRSKGRASSEGLAPIERAYLEAKNRAWLDPEVGLTKFQALVDLYKDRTDLPGPVGQCLELAQRQIEHLRRQLAPATADCQFEIQTRLSRAAELSESDPETARAIRQAIVELFRDKPWARETVAEARRLLALPQPPSQNKP